MIAVGESVTETIKQIIQSLQIRFLFPAIVFVMLNILLFSYIFNFDIKVDETFFITLTVVSIILFSYLFCAFNGLIIRLAEGYELRHNWIYDYKYKKQKKEYNKLIREIEKCKSNIDKIKLIENDLCEVNALTESRQIKINKKKKFWENRKNSLLEEKNFRFSEMRRFPTNIGNTIAAFEHYPKERYGIDAVYLWPRLLPILKNKNFLELVQNEKTTLDFLLNNGLICIFISIELLTLFCFKSNGYFICFFLIAAFFSWLFYYAANAVARDWGIMVCTAFDLYREELRKNLFLPELKKISTLDDEKEMWNNISQFIIFGDTSPSFNHFTYPRATYNCSGD